MLPECELMNICMIVDTSTNRTLMQRRAKKYWPGLAFPGGHVEPGEGFGESVAREVREETGLEIKNARLCGFVHWEHTQTGRRSIIACYRAENYSGELRAVCDEGTNEWTPIERLHSIELAPWLKEQLVVFEGAVSELYYVYDDEGVKQVRPY